MKYVYIGKIVNTHALKGEVRILSNFEFKDRVFKPGIKVYMGQFKTEEEIETYRPHKQFDMVKFVNIDNIQDVLKYKGDAVYVGDSDVDIQTAHNAGIPCISVLWGFRDKDFLLQHGAKILISAPSELLF